VSTLLIDQNSTSVLTIPPGTNSAFSNRKLKAIRRSQSSVEARAIRRQEGHAILGSWSNIWIEVFAFA
jgi:hypothetical protein